MESADLLRAQDCEFTYLSTQILHLLGREGPRTKEPARYIRYIYNRIILENATVRAAAVASLARFGALVADLRPRILVLLSRALYDNDDEARRPALGCCFDACSALWLCRGHHPRKEVRALASCQLNDKRDSRECQVVRSPAG